MLRPAQGSAETPQCRQHGIAFVFIGQFKPLRIDFQVLAYLVAPPTPLHPEHPNTVQENILCLFAVDARGPDQGVARGAEQHRETEALDALAPLGRLG